MRRYILTIVFVEKWRSSYENKNPRHEDEWGGGSVVSQICNLGTGSIRIWLKHLKRFLLAVQTGHISNPLAVNTGHNHR